MTDWTNPDKYNKENDRSMMVECYRPDLKKRQTAIVFVEPENEIVMFMTEDNTAIGVHLNVVKELLQRYKTADTD